MTTTIFLSVKYLQARIGIWDKLGEQGLHEVLKRDFLTFIADHPLPQIRQVLEEDPSKELKEEDIENVIEDLYMAGESYKQDLFLDGHSHIIAAFSGIYPGDKIKPPRKPKQRPGKEASDITVPSEGTLNSELFLQYHEKLKRRRLMLSETPLVKMAFEALLMRGFEEKETATTTCDCPSYILPMRQAMDKYIHEQLTFRDRIAVKSNYSTWKLVNVLTSYAYLPLYLQANSDFSTQQCSWEVQAKVLVEGKVKTVAVSDFTFKCGYFRLPEEKSCACTGRDFFRIYETGIVFHYTEVNDKTGDSLHECSDHLTKSPKKVGLPFWMKLFVDHYALVCQTPKEALGKVKERIGVTAFSESKISTRIEKTRKKATEKVHGTEQEEEEETFLENRKKKREY
jgi:hypothetical protein